MRFSTTPKMIRDTVKKSHPMDRRTALLRKSRKGATTPRRISTTSDVVAAGCSRKFSWLWRTMRSPIFTMP